MSLAAMAGRALLQEDAAAVAAAPDTTAVDTSFLLMSAYLVFFMQAGFAMVRSRPPRHGPLLGAATPPVSPRPDNARS